MATPALTGAEKSRLRSQGQRMEPSLTIGKAGLTPLVKAEIDRQFAARDLFKARFVGFDRAAREALCAQIEAEAACACVGAVGHTALFYRSA